MSILEKCNVNSKGAGAAIIFAHGYGCDQNMWRYVAPRFESDYRVVLFDYVGAGKSDRKSYSPSKYSDLKGYAEDVLEIIEALGLKDVIFVGHSVSSMIGVLAALKKPKIFSKLILVGPSASYINDADYYGGFSRQDINGLLESLDSNYLGWASAMAPVIMANPARPELGAELTNSFCQTDPKIAKRFARATFLSDNRADLKHVTTPTLVLQCSDDVIAPAAVGEYVHKCIPGSEIVYLQATGHCPNLSAPDETYSAINSFLSAKT